MSLASIDVPLVVNEATADFQEATVQAELPYRVTDPQRLATSLDYSIDGRGRFRSDDPMKLSDRLVHAAQSSARSFMQRRPLRDVLVGSDLLVVEMLSPNLNPFFTEYLRFKPAIAGLNCFWGLN